MAETIKVKNAIDYLKESNLFKADKFRSLHPLIQKQLDDTITKEDIYRLLNAVAPLQEEAKGDTEDKPKTQIKSSQTEEVDIGLIKEIKDIHNVGLINNIPSIKIDPKINIFYGRNASGKSSVYKVLCNTLGYHDKSVSSDINKEELKCKCCVVIENRENKPDELFWESDKKNKRAKVKIFDSDISLSLVKDDQDNAFSLVHLKREYFEILSSLLQTLEDKLKGRKGILEPKYLYLEQALSAKAKSTLDDVTNKKLGEEYILKTSLSETEQAEYKKVTEEQEVLKIINFDDKVKIVDNLLEQIDGILHIIPSRYEENTAKILLTNEYFKEIDEKIEELTKLKKIYDGSYAIKLKGLLPEDWLKNEKWINFIDSSLDFIKNLSEKEKNVYLKEKCAYCQQDLSIQAKNLVKNYEELQDATKEKIKDFESGLLAYKDVLIKVIDKLELLSEKKIHDIDKNIKTFIQSDKPVVSISAVLNIIKKYSDSISDNKKPDCSNEDLLKIEELYDYYSYFYTKLSEQKDNYLKEKENKNKKIQALEEQLSPLRKKKEIVENKNEFLKYIEYGDNFKNIDETLGIISDAKYNLSISATNFSKDIIMEGFQKYLDDEYKALNFEKPLKYKIKTKTSYAENKRFYLIGDRKIKDIFSEGEQKQHALADFFAQCKFEKFNGVYIFDDPVTSLDEHNMHCLAKRIMSLTKEKGNQLLIFTHNVIFLNILLELKGDEKMHHFKRTSCNIFFENNTQRNPEESLKKNRKHIDDLLKTVEEKEKNGSSTENDIRDIYGFISESLENIVEDRLLQRTIIRFRPNIRARNLRKIKWDSIKNVADDIADLYSKTDGLANRHFPTESTTIPILIEVKKDVEVMDNLISKL